MLCMQNNIAWIRCCVFFYPLPKKPTGGLPGGP